jgi:signal transduction histidine kinase
LLLGAGLLDLLHAVSYVTMASSMSGLVESESRLFSAGSRVTLAAGLFCYVWLPERPAGERSRWSVLFAVLAVTAGSATVVAGTFARFIPSEAITDRLQLSPASAVVLLLTAAIGRAVFTRRSVQNVTLVSACVMFTIREVITLYGANEAEVTPRLFAHGCEVAGCVLLYRGLVVGRLRRPAEAATKLRTALRITEAQLLRAQAIAAFATYRVYQAEAGPPTRLLGADAANLLDLAGATRMPESEYVAKVVHEHDRHQFADAARRLAEGGKSACEYRVIVPAGDVRVIRDVAEVLADGDGRELLGVLHDVTEYRRIEDELRRLAAHVESAREAERSRISREIHDELGGLLTGIRMQLAMSVRERIEQPRIAESLEISLQLIDSATEALRRVIRDLRPSILDDLGPVAAIEWYADERLGRSGLDVRFTAEAAAVDLALAGERASALFRVSQEAMTNIARHAHASRVSIGVTLARGRLVVQIEDDGRGMNADDPASFGSWGLLGMRERLRHFGGELRLQSAIGGGTNVTIIMPIEAADE